MDINASPRFGLAREERLRRRGAISELFAQGEAGFVYPIRYVAHSNGTSANSVLFTVPKKFHRRANKRNLLRRRVKEAYRLNKKIFTREGGMNIALIYSTKEPLEYAAIERAVVKILTTLNSSTK